MKPHSAKAKGRALLIWLKEKLLDTFPDTESDDWKVTSSGSTGEDLQPSPFARKKFPFSIEGKSHKSMAIYRVLEQAESNCNGYEPLLILKENRKEPIIAVKADVFLNLIKNQKNLDQ